MKTTLKETDFKFACMTIAICVCSLTFFGTSQAQGEFTVSSPVIEKGGPLPVKYSCDGEGISIPIDWSGIPDGTRYFAVNVWHIPNQGGPGGKDEIGPGGPPPGGGEDEKRPDGPPPKNGEKEKGPGAPPPKEAKDDEKPGDGPDVKSYWLLYNIPADVNGLPEDAKGIGTDGYSDKMKTGFDPMCSGGPGLKTYHVTVWALSAEPAFATDRVQRVHLLEAIKDITLAEATLSLGISSKINYPSTGCIVTSHLGSDGER